MCQTFASAELQEHAELGVAVLGGGVSSQICWAGASPEALCFLRELGVAVHGGGVGSQIGWAGAFAEAMFLDRAGLVVGCVLKSAGQENPEYPEALFFERALLGAFSNLLGRSIQRLQSSVGCVLKSAGREHSQSLCFLRALGVAARCIPKAMILDRAGCCGACGAVHFQIC